MAVESRGHMNNRGRVEVKVSGGRTEGTLTSRESGNIGDCCKHKGLVGVLVPGGSVQDRCKCLDRGWWKCW